MRGGQGCTHGATPDLHAAVRAVRAVQVRAAEQHVRDNPKGELGRGGGAWPGRHGPLGGRLTTRRAWRLLSMRVSCGPSGQPRPALLCCLMLLPAPLLPSLPAVSSELSREMTALRQRLYKLKNEEKAGSLTGARNSLRCASSCCCAHVVHELHSKVEAGMLTGT